MSPLPEFPRSAPDVEVDVVIVETRTTLLAASSDWRPPINAYRCRDQVVVFVDLAGVPRESVELRVLPERVVIRGRRPAPEPAGEASDQCHLLALEIDHGTFERTLDLPQAVNPEEVTTEYRDGLFRIALGLRT